MSFFSQSVLYCIKCDTKVFASGLNAGLQRAFYGPLLYKEASFKGSVFLQVGVITEKCFCSSRVNSQVSSRKICLKESAGLHALPHTHKRRDTPVTVHVVRDVLYIQGYSCCMQPLTDPELTATVQKKDVMVCMPESETFSLSSHK